MNSGGHAAYQARLICLLKQYYPDAFTRFGPSLWNTIGRFYSMDLAKIDVIGKQIEEVASRFKRSCEVESEGIPESFNLIFAKDACTGCSLTPCSLTTCISTSPVMPT